jgi:hypothetical protein
MKCSGVNRHLEVDTRLKKEEGEERRFMALIIKGEKNYIYEQVRELL